MLTESVIEAFAIKLLERLGYVYLHGPSIPTRNRNHVHAQKTPIPPRELIEQFENMVAPLFRKAARNDAQITSLKTLRDTLLPKLMSGEVRMAV